MNLRGALAIFVKTPELSPVKTRLAASIGAENARQFYELALTATSAMAGALQTSIPYLQIYWAVAETEGLRGKRWKSFPSIAQGSGDLGDRLNSVYQELLKTHHFVCFIGADSPHLSVENLRVGILQTAQHVGKKFVIGETFDGGFYFFGGGAKIPSSAWLGVEYSTDQTANQLAAGLLEFGEIERLEKNFDVDTVDDLRRYTKISSQADILLPEQRDLIHWAEGMK